MAFGIKALNKDEFMEGARSALPIFIGYFTTSLAFGLLAVSIGVSPLLAVLFSATNLTGAAQFMAINLLGSGSALGEILISVMLMNMRYFIMSMAISQKIDFRSFKDRFLIAFGITDEIFSVASLRTGLVSRSFMAGIQSFSWLGWTTGTIAGVTIGAFLPKSLQDAMSGALFALFAALLVPEIKKGHLPLLLALSAGGLNSALYYLWNVPAGWSIVISMLVVTAVGAATFKEGPLADADTDIETDIEPGGCNA